MGPSAWGSPGAGGTERGGSGGQSGHCRTSLWHIVALSVQPGGGRAAVPALSGPSVVPSGAGGDWCGSRGRTSMSPAGEGTRTGRSAMDACGMRKNVGLLRIPGKRCWGAAGARCPQGRVPKAASCPRCGRRKLRTPFGSLFPPSSEGCGGCAPSQALRCHPKGVPHISGGLMGGSPPQAPHP